MKSNWAENLTLEIRRGKNAQALRLWAVHLLHLSLADPFRLWVFKCTDPEVSLLQGQKGNCPPRNALQSESAANTRLLMTQKLRRSQADECHTRTVIEMDILFI